MSLYHDTFIEPLLRQYEEEADHLLQGDANDDGDADFDA